MEILIAYFSRTGHTRKLVETIEKELIRRGHSVKYEVINPIKSNSWVTDVLLDAPRWLSIGISLVSNRWLERHINNYKQVEVEINELQYPDVSKFDIVCIGTPKWTQISFPVARYIQVIQGIQGKEVAVFSTFAGPPLKRFELALVFQTMRRFLEKKGARLITSLGVSSAYHPNPLMIPIFKLLSWMFFKQPIKNFMLGSEYASNHILKFCDAIDRQQSIRV